MIDEIAIQQTISRYSDGASRADWDQVASTFTEDGVWEVGSSGKTFQGHEAIREGLGALSGEMEFVVQINSPALIAVDGDAATARSTIREFGKMAGRDEGFEALGFYEDQLAATADGWKFTHRTFTLKAKHTYALLPGGIVR